MTHETSIEAQPYWDGLSRKELWLQQCAGCGAVRHYPRPMCPHCHSMASTWAQARGTGTVHSWTVTHQTSLPGYTDRVPYILVTVDLAEGVRMLAPLMGASVDDVRTGLAVRIAFEQHGDDAVMPVFAKVNPHRENP